TVQVNDPGQTVTMAGAWVVGATLTVTAGILAEGANNLGVTGLTTVTGTLNGGSGTRTLAGGVVGGGTLTASSATTNIGGNMTVTTFNASGGTVVFNGAGPQSVNGYTFDTVQVNDPGQTVTMACAWVVGATLTVTAGILAEGANNL